MNTIIDIIKLSKLTFAKVYISSWIFINWKIVLTILDINSSVKDKINGIEGYFSYDSFLKALGLSMAIACVTLFFDHVLNVMKTFFQVLDTLVFKKADDRIKSASEYYYESTTKLNLVLLNYIVSLHRSIDILEQNINIMPPEKAKCQVKIFKENLEITNKELNLTKEVIEFVSKKLSSFSYTFTNTKRDILEIYTLVIAKKDVRSLKETAAQVKEEQERITQELFDSLKKD